MRASNLLADNINTFQAWNWTQELQHRGCLLRHTSCSRFKGSDINRESQRPQVTDDLWEWSLRLKFLIRHKGLDSIRCNRFIIQQSLLDNCHNLIKCLGCTLYKSIKRLNTGNSRDRKFEKDYTAGLSLNI